MQIAVNRARQGKNIIPIDFHFISDWFRENGIPVLSFLQQLPSLVLKAKANASSFSTQIKTALLTNSNKESKLILY